MTQWYYSFPVYFWLCMIFWIFKSTLGMTFLGFPIKCLLRMPFFGLSTQVHFREVDSNQFMTQEVPRRLESIQLMTRAAFQEWTQNQLMTQMDSPGNDSNRRIVQAASLGIKLVWLMAQNTSPFLDSNKIMTQAKKNIWFWVDSALGSESYRCLPLTSTFGTSSGNAPAPILPRLSKS